MLLFLLRKLLSLGIGAASAWGGSGGEIPYRSKCAFCCFAAGAAWDEYTRKGGVKRGSVDLTNSGHTYADGDDQYGFALRTYLMMLELVLILVFTLLSTIVRFLI